MVQYHLKKYMTVKKTITYYFHGREVGLPIGGLPRCHEVGSIQQVIYIYIISTVVRSGLPTGGLPRCREVGSIQHVIYIISSVVRSGLPIGGFPRCREVGFIRQVIYYSHSREVGFTDKWFSTLS